MTTKQRTELLHLLTRVNKATIVYTEAMNSEDRFFAEYMNGTANGVLLCLEILGIEPEVVEAEPDSEDVKPEV